MAQAKSDKSQKAYKTFKRSANSLSEFSKARKITVDKGLTYAEAKRQCDNFNKSRTSAQIKKGTMMEFTVE